MASKDGVMETYNHDISGYCCRTNRFMVDLSRSVSAGVVSTNEFDQARWASYLDALDSYLDHVQSEPNLDLPESHPRLIQINCMSDEDVMKLDNDAIRDCLYYLKLSMIEMCNSQSSRTPSKLISFDESRCRALIQKARNLLNNYVQVIQPIDVPESHPRDPQVVAGKQGV